MIIFQARTVHAMLSSLFEIQSCIRGHYVYKNVWNAVCMQKVSLSGSPLFRNLNADVVGLPYADGLGSDVGHKPDVIDLSEHAHNYNYMLRYVNVYNIFTNILYSYSILISLGMIQLMLCS